MKIKDTILFTDSTFPADSFVLVTIPINANEKRVHRVPTSLFLSNVAGPVGPSGPPGPAGPSGGDGTPGAPGTNGTNGTNGADGAPGQGVPIGGTAGQVLAKIDGTDYNAHWIAAPSGDPAVGGDLSGVASNATVTRARGLLSTGTLAGTLAIGQITGNQVLQRVGSDIVGLTLGSAALADVAPPGDEATSGEVPTGSDPRMTNARTPTMHAASHQNGGSDEIATATATANAIPKAGAGAKLDIGWVPTGITSTTVPLGNDPRFSDARTPTAHAASHAPAGTDALPWTTAHGRGATGSRPAAAASNAGYLYYDTTLLKMQRSNGTTWDDVSETGVATGGSAYNIFAKDGSNVAGWTSSPRVVDFRIQGDLVSNITGLFTFDTVNGGFSVSTNGVPSCDFVFSAGVTYIRRKSGTLLPVKFTDVGSVTPIDISARGVLLTTNVMIGGIQVVGAQQPSITNLADSVGGTVTNTLAALPDPTDTPLTADDLRDDLVANLIPVLRDALSSNAAKFVEILDMLRAHGLIAPPAPGIPADPTIAANDGYGILVQLPSFPAYATEFAVFVDAVEVASGLGSGATYLFTGGVALTGYAITIAARNGSGDTFAAGGLNPTTVDVPTATPPVITDMGGGQFNVVFGALSANGTAGDTLRYYINSSGPINVNPGDTVNANPGDAIDAEASELNLYGIGGFTAATQVILT